MARLTPIERAIAGDPVDRRKRYEERMRAEGFTRVTAMVRTEDAEILHAVAKMCRDEPDGPARLHAMLAKLQVSAGRTERPQRREDAPRARQRLTASK